jgi:hypothetical protein
MKEHPGEEKSLWQKTQYANLIRYKPSKAYFARIRINGKLIRRSLKTSVLSVAKLRLGDMEKKERQLAEHQTTSGDGRMTFGGALNIYERRLKGDVSLKPRTREYHEQRITNPVNPDLGLVPQIVENIRAQRVNSHLWNEHSDK